MCLYIALQISDARLRKGYPGTMSPPRIKGTNGRREAANGLRARRPGLGAAPILADSGLIRLRWTIAYRYAIALQHAKSQFDYSSRHHRFLEVSLPYVAFCIMELHVTDPLALHISFRKRAAERYERQ